MADEIHETRAPDGTVHTTTVIDREPRRGGGMGVGLIVLAAILVAAFFGFQFLANDTAQSGAITEAAQKVGSAAEDVGDAAQKAVE